MSVVPRFRRDVQSEVRARTPTPWIHPSARRPVVAVATSSRFVPPVIADMRTARARADSTPGAPRSVPPGAGISAVRKGASIIATSSAPTALA